jgi:hypothetical protein
MSIKGNQLIKNYDTSIQWNTMNQKECKCSLYTNIKSFPRIMKFKSQAVL